MYVIKFYLKKYYIQYSIICVYILYILYFYIIYIFFIIIRCIIIIMHHAHHVPYDIIYIEAAAPLKAQLLDEQSFEKWEAELRDNGESGPFQGTELNANLV